MLSPSRPLIAWIAILLLLITKGSAATFLAEGYSVRVWQTDDGLPQNMVTSAVQTRDGYLWLGTYAGLARFDGERFRVFDSANTPELRDRRISSLFEDAQGTLWIGHEAGVITRYQEGRFESFTNSSGIMGEKVIGLGSDAQGHLWAMRENGAVDSVPSGTRVPSLIAPALPGVMAWTRSVGGDIWVAENGQAAQLAGGNFNTVSLGPPRNEDYVLGIAAASDGGVWMLCDNRVRKWKDGRWTEDRGVFPWPPGPLACALELRDGTLAVGTIYSGLHLISRGGRRAVYFDRSKGLPQNWVRFLYEDREANLWFGAGSAGLVSIHATAFSVLNSPDQWQGCTVLSVAPGRDGSLWIGTDGATLYHYSAGEWKHYGDAEGLPNGYIPAVTESKEGDVWVGHFWWGSPYRLENDRFVRPENVDEKSSPVFALLAGHGVGELLVGNRDGLVQLKEGDRATWLVKSPDGSAGAACAIALEKAGGIWCGFEEGGLAHLADGRLAMFHQKDGLASDAVRCLLSDDDGSLWIGTADSGLSRFKDGRFANLSTAHGLADNGICYILDDGLGYFWLSTHHGIQRVSKDELNRCADGAMPTFPSQIYDRSDGLPVVEFTGGLQAAGCKTSDGRLWFGSSKGLLSVDPARIRPNPLSPPVVFESLWVDGKNLPIVDPSVRQRLSPDHQRLEFRFSGLSFVAPSKVLFRYRLDGIDQTWVEAGSRRTAFYSRLPAGTYRFRVIACNNEGVWNTEGVSVAFTVAPFFWQTWWFISLCVLLAAVTVASLARQLTRRRMQRQIEQMERQHEIERERARIAQDIHDDVGASLSRIAMLSQPAHSDLTEPGRTAAMLSRIYTTAREVTRSLDEIVWAVDPRHDTLDSLVDYMGKFAQHFLGATNIRCRLDLPVEVPPWPLTAETRHNLFLAFKEALNNAAKHAVADEVRISFDLRPDSFVLVVKDNGRGFAAHASTRESDRVTSGSGLVNMQARLARIGGRCEISSTPGEGTSVSFVVGVAGQSVPPPSAPSAGACDPSSQPVL